MRSYILRMVILSALKMTQKWLLMLESSDEYLVVVEMSDRVMRTNPWRNNFLSLFSEHGVIIVQDKFKLQFQKSGEQYHAHVSGSETDYSGGSITLIVTKPS